MTIAGPPRPLSPPPPLATRGHTAALAALILTVAVTGSWLQCSGASEATIAVRVTSSGGRILAQYFPLLLVNAGLVLYVARLFRGRNALPELLGPPPTHLRDALVDVLLGALAFVAIVMIEALTRAIFAGRNAAVLALLPSTEAERLTWLLVALSVGLCEEVVYRGYFQTQLSAFTRSTTLGLLLQALLFALAHLEQGAFAAAKIAVHGLILGALAQKRGRLLPGILCHIAIDLAAGLAR